MVPLSDVRWPNFNCKVMTILSAENPKAADTDDEKIELVTLWQ